MRGVVFSRGQAVVRDDLAPPLPADGETRVRVLRAGVCATDLALRAGYMNFEGVPGHEFCGRALDGPLAGQRVVGEINAGCGRCADCVAGDPRHCPSRTVLGILGRSGAFAEELSLPTRNLHVVPDEVSSDAASFCEPLAAAFQIPAEVALTPEDRALVCGDGRLGLLCAQVLASRGLRVTVRGRHPERARLLGPSSDFAGPLEVDSLPARDDDRFDVVVEATGRAEVLARALQWVKPRGTLVLKTTTEKASKIDLAPVVVNEIRLVGSRCGPFEPALRALQRAEIPVLEMIDDRFPLERAVEALDAASRPGVLKVVIDVAEDD